MVRRFIQKARLEAAYKIAVLTYGNMQFVATELWDEISRKAGGAPFDYITSILMVDNWLPNFDMSEQIKIDKHIPESLGRIKADLTVRGHEIPAASEQAKQLFNRFISGRGLDPSVGYLMRSEDYFVITDACIGCAVCTEVCPRGNYKLTSMGVKTEGDFDFCFACIQNCPQKAIRFRRAARQPVPGSWRKEPQCPLPRANMYHCGASRKAIGNKSRRPPTHMHGDGKRLIFSAASGMQLRGYAPCMRRKEQPLLVCPMVGVEGLRGGQTKCPDGLNVKKSV